MALTPAILRPSAAQRQDLKCGNGAISKGEKCTKGAATQAEKEKKGGASTAPKLLTAKNVFRAAAAVNVAVSLNNIRNNRQAYDTKFGGTNRVTPLDKPFGDMEGALKSITADTSKTASPSLFGTVGFGKLDGKSVVLKTVDKSKLPLVVTQADLGKATGQYTESAARNLVAAAKGVTKQEVDHARIAGAAGFGPKVIAADSTRILMETAQGRPLISQDRSARMGGPAKIAAKPGRLVGIVRRNLTKGTQISDVQKRRVISTMGKMHTAGFAHNDLHPGNIFVSNKGAQFIDYGASSRGGRSTAHEFVQMMNKPRSGLLQNGGMGYNLKSVDPKGYAATEKALKQAIGKKIGSLTAADIAKAKANGSDFEERLQQIVDDYYRGFEQRSRSGRRDTRRADAQKGKPCGASHIPKAQTCTKGTARQAVLVGATALTAGALGIAAGRAIGNGSANRALQSTIFKAGQLVSKRPTARSARLAPRITLTPKAFENIRPTAKTARLAGQAREANQAAEKAIAKAAQLEIERAAAVGTAMYKTGKATRASLRSGMRTHNLTVERLRRRYEPGYRRPARP
jgi:hypothetical protein